MKNLKYLPLFIGILAASAFAQSGALGAAQRITGDRFTYSATTKQGANVMGVKRPSAAMLDAIDKGLTELFAVARKNGYR